ncbi:MAG: ImmA/IrrE family metallo-endopeptidase [Dehalococcoidales bacterium]|nr:MAG: ImmA/IrrE family metallo-endopeptidase [Dehalococcoidales bacterium]
MKRETPRWESTLWSYISSGDGEQCPLHDKCRLLAESGQCLDDVKDYLARMNTFIEKDELSFNGPEPAHVELMKCPKLRAVFKLTEKLAKKVRDLGNIHSPPVPDVLIALFDTDRSIEVREVPLNVYHAAIWRFSDRWVVHLNENDTPARKRFSLFHEAFHILAHCKTSPVFKKIGSNKGSFNEFLADHFAGCLMMPPEWAREKWPECHDIDKMSEIFGIPKSIAWLGLKASQLI